MQLCACGQCLDKMVNWRGKDLRDVMCSLSVRDGRRRVSDTCLSATTSLCQCIPAVRTAVLVAGYVCVLQSRRECHS